ncbi:MAG TPA: ABC transporter substrate-binding protein [Candidatus Bathyarchaeia archaeon]|jgi:branched-chain amino acid transport system substrate-binding protein|nr:ABC transporter substrate-binding protein [Candidatus Bathyarchaeia archaeon]
MKPKHALVSLVLLGLLGCGGGGGDKGAGGSTTAPAGGGAASGSGPILVGHFGSMTGSEATFGQSTDNGIRLAVKEQNAAGGVKGRMIEIKTYDDQGKSQEAGTAVTRLITDDKVAAVLGEVASSLSLAGGRVAQQYGVPMISPSSTNPQVTQIGDKIFRVCFLDPFQGWVEAKFARETLKANTAAILYDQAQAYSKGLAQYFKEAFVQMGGTITTEQAFTGGDQDFSAQLTTIRQTNPDVILVPGYYTDAGNVAIQVRKLGIKAPLLGGDGWDSTQLAAIGKDAIEGSYFSNHYSFQEKRPEVENFVSKYEAAHGQKPDGLAALGYDAARLLFDAMGRAPSLDGTALAKAIAETKDFPGVTGKITIDAERNAKKSAVIVQMKGGIPVYVTTIEPQQ